MFWNENCIYKVRAGSHAYGTNTPTSDLDLRAICCPPAKYIYGLDYWEQKDDRQNDSTVFSLHKFARLALNGNPNVLEWLWVRDVDVLLCTEAGGRLRAIRDAFTCKRLSQSFGGYAHAQLKKFVSNCGKRGRAGVIPEGESADWKDAMHLIRLLRTGIEIMDEGVINVYRKDRDDLMAIRAGLWSQEEVLAHANELEGALKRATDETSLPEHPDYNTINSVVMEITMQSLEGDRYGIASRST